ncbi:MAG: ATP-binding cassette domain-containing protein, partial [Desulfofustis sp.]
MSSLLSCRAISKAYGAQRLFSGLDLVIGDGDRIGLIGPNGSGKSTLLKIICGLEELDDGTIDRRTNSIVSYLAQADRFIEQRGPLENLLEALDDSPLPEEQKLSRAQSLLSRIELDDLEKPVAQLSGGWRKRLSICRSLVVEPDLLVMDEPTNHLDIEGIIWLERLLDSKSPLSPPTFILISHDRRFLENTTNRTVELSSSYPGGSFQVEGQYSRFLEKKAAFLEQQQRLEEKLANKMRRETQWLQRGPKARTTKARYRIDEAHRLFDRLDTVKKQNRAENQVGIDFTASGRKTKKLMEVHDLG